MTPGIHDGLAEDIYHASPGVSVSRLKRFAEAPAKALVQRPETKALALGSMLHTMLLEPEQFDRRYCVTTLTRISEREKATQAELTRAAGRELVKESDYEAAQAVRVTVLQHPVIRDILAPGYIIERSFGWHDDETGLLCRGRADIIRPDMRLVADIKTTTDASPRAFARAAADYKYHWQESFYRTGITATHNWEPEAFLFIAIEKEAPYLPGIYYMPPETVDPARAQLRAQLRRYAECEATGIWPGYADEPQPLHLPEWALF
jgi:exodeoxyribonuclease VIII